MPANTRGVWPISTAASRRAEHRLALTIATTFTVFGGAWVLLTDALVYAMTEDPVLIARIETAKGWAFVAGAGALVYFVTARSASLLARAQAILSAVVESIADGLLILGPDRTIVHANAAALRLLGCDRLRDLVGMGAPEFSRRFRLSYPDHFLVPPDQFASQRVFTEGGPLRYKAVVQPTNAPERVIATTAAAVRDEVGEPAEVVVAVMHDITASEHLERERDQFFAAAAHSLKTPVAIVKANAQVLSRASGPPLRRATEAIERQCSRIDRLVQNLLVLARARSHTLQLHPAELELGPMVAQVVREMASASPQHELSADIAVSPRIRADQERLTTVLRNLVDDAFHAAPAGSRVTVLLRRNGADAEIGVKHRRVPPEERGPDAYAEYDDLSIGRCVTRMVVEAHGGALREESAGPETIAWMSLPGAEEAPSAEGAHGGA